MDRTKSLQDVPQTEIQRDDREQIKQDAESFYKMRIFMLVNDALDRMEERGNIEIFNDYDNEQILLRKNQ